MKRQWWVGIVLLLPMTLAFAVKMPNLYQTEVAVAAQTEDLKAQAIKEGFNHLLIKLSGDPSIAKNPLIKASLNRPDYYVKDFSYSAPTPASSHYSLRINFEENDVNRLLNKAGVAYWGNTRPLILVWLAISSRENGTEIIGNEMPNDIYNTLQQQSDRYGLPLIFPMMDVADVSQISPEDVLNMSLPTLKEAGKRYSPDGLLIGKIKQEKGQYISQWQLILNDKNNEWEWNVSDKSIDKILSTVLTEVSQSLAKHYVTTKPIEVKDLWLNIEVINVTQQKDLADLLQYVKQIPAVKQVKLLEVSSDVVELSVLVDSSREAFKTNAAAGQRLTLKYQDPQDQKMVYVWSS